MAVDNDKGTLGLDVEMKNEATEEGHVQHNVELRRALKARHITMIGMRLLERVGRRLLMNSHWGRHWNRIDHWHRRSPGKVSLPYAYIPLPLNPETDLHRAGVCTIPLSYTGNTTPNAI